MWINNVITPVMLFCLDKQADWFSGGNLIGSSNVYQTIVGKNSELIPVVRED